MSWQLPRDLVVKMIEPLFSAKLRYGLELAVNIRKEETDTGLRSLHRVHRAAMKAAFSIPTREHPETSIYYVQQTNRRQFTTWRCKPRLGWCGVYARNWKEHPLTGSRIEHHGSVNVDARQRNERNARMRT
jgi:hypothetical protein